MLRDGIVDHTHEIPPAEFDFHKLEAFEYGTVGWAFAHFEFRIPSLAASITARSTQVFALEKGLWKVAQIHHSIPTPNSDILGFEHHAIDQMIAAAKDHHVSDEHGQIVAIMFTDVANSTKLARSVGDTRWVEVIQAHISEVQADVEAHGGTLIKSLGDGTMSRFGSASATLKAAKGLQEQMRQSLKEPALNLRIGIHTGQVIEAGDDFFGTVVNMAARIASVAEPQEIRVSEATKLMVGAQPVFVFSEPREVALKGFDGLHAVSRLIV